MLKRLVEIKTSLMTLCPTDSVLAELQLSDDEWRRISLLQRLLKPFNRATQLLSAEKTPSLSTFFPIYRALLSHLAKDDWSSSNTIQQVRDSLRFSLAQRWPIVNGSEPWCLAAVLDPRFKRHSYFCTVNNPTWTALKQLCLAEAKTLPPSLPSTLSLKLTSLLEVVPVPCKKRKLAELIDLGQTIETEISEFEQYFCSPAISLDEDPLQWWSTHETSFPILSQLARKYLAIPATSTPAERLFSDAGNIITKKRTALDPETVEKLLFLFENQERLCFNQSQLTE
jgi:hypothetical protein